MNKRKRVALQKHRKNQKKARLRRRERTTEKKRQR